MLVGGAIPRNKGGDATHRGPLRPVASLGCGLLVLAPVCAFWGLMVAVAGVALHPPVVTVAAPYVCDGTVETQSHPYSYRPGQHGVARNILCIAADGGSRDITLRTIGAASIFYTLIFLAAALVLWGLVRLLKPRGGANVATEIDSPRAAVMRSFLADRLRIDADIVRQTDIKPDTESLEARLKRLEALRDDGLISEEEHQAKRAEILSGL